MKQYDDIDSFPELVAALNTSPISTDVLHDITLILEQINNESSLLDDKQFLQSLLILERWIWQLLSQESHEWINDLSYQKLFYTIALFNKKLVFENNNLDKDTIASFLFAVTIDQINDIFTKIDRIADENSLYFTLLSLSFNSQSYFLFESSQYILPIIDYVGQCIIEKYVLTHQYKLYLIQLRKSDLSKSIFTEKLLFYISTCSFYTYSYIIPKNKDLSRIADDVIDFLREDYLQIIHVHSSKVSTWCKELIDCIAHLISFVVGCGWWDAETKTRMKMLCPEEKTACDHIQNLMEIISYQPFHHEIKPVRSNAETILVNATLALLIMLVQTYNVSWLFCTNTNIRDTIVSVAENTVNNDISLCGYNILGEVLTDEQLKELKIADHAGSAFFKILEYSWNETGKIYKHISIQFLLKGFLALSKNDCIKQKTADLNKIPLFIEMTDGFPIAYDIVWALSFNHEIQEQLHSNSAFMTKLSQLAEEPNNEEMRKAIHGILWNLEINHENHPRSDIDGGKTFDIMISYCHKEKAICTQIYGELMKDGYRVWIDFDQMHGNVMDAMAQAIEQSRTVIICMSENYRKSSYCRAEAQYAFQQQRKIVPILLQKHYKPDGWLLFLIGPLLYVDFNKYEFPLAIEMLYKEIKAEEFTETKVKPVLSKEETVVTSLTHTELRSSSSILEWTKEQVHNWLLEHNLVQMARLLEHCDGRTLIYLSRYMKNCQSQQILNLIQEDANRRIHENLSLIELCTFQSLMDQQRQTLNSMIHTEST